MSNLCKVINTLVLNLDNEGQDRTVHSCARSIRHLYRFPCMTIDDLSSTDRVIRPFCDQAHQMFGRKGWFDAEGAWIAR
jgi:hypothetical protein